MHTMIKAVLTAACIVAIAWPLVFWGKPEAPATNGRNVEQVAPPRAPFATRSWYHEFPAGFDSLGRP